MRCNCVHQMLSRHTGALSWAWVAFDTTECVCKETTTTSHVINDLLTQRLPLCRVAMFRSVTGGLLPHYVTLSGWMRLHCITETRGKAGTAAPREEPLKWDVLSNESNTQWLLPLRQLFWGHVTAGALGGVFFFLNSMAELEVGASGGWVLPTLTVVLCCFDSACPLRNNNMYAIVRRINRICNLVSLQRVFALLPRRNSRNDNLSTCLAWQTVAAMMKKQQKKHTLSTHLLIYVFICQIPTYFTSCLIRHSLILCPHAVSVPFLLQSCPEGDVCCWCPYFGQQCAGLRGHHNKVCWLIVKP